METRKGRVVLDPGQFYIFASKENVVIPPDEAAEMAPIRPELGEFRAHYAGFFDPGFGIAPNEGRAVLEVRSRDVPFIVEDGQPVGNWCSSRCLARLSGSMARRARTIRGRA
jgi:dCTP deaminase